MDPEEFFIAEWKTDVTLPTGEVVDGIFDRQSLTASLGIGIDASNPQVAILSAVAETLNEGDGLTIKGKTYTARGFEPDGEGITLVDLGD